MSLCSLSLRSFLRTVAIGAAAMLWAGNASAATFGISSVTFDLHDTEGGGLWIKATSHVPSSYPFSLAAVGDSWFIPNLFDVRIFEDCCFLDDKDVSPFSVNVQFSAPAGASGGIVTGTSVGYGAIFDPSGANIKWNGPGVVSFADGTLLRIALSSVDIECDEMFCTDRPTRLVAGTFTLLALPKPPPVSAVPLPATLPLFAAGLGVIGGAGLRRRKRRKA